MPSNIGDQIDVQTVPALFSRALCRRPNRLALRGESCSLTYGEIHRRSNALANAVRELGVVPETRVATVLSNRLETPVVDVGILKSGAVRLPINPVLSSEVVEHVLSEAEPAVLFCDDERIDEIGKIVDGLPTRPTCVVVGSTDPPDGWRTMNSLVDDGSTTRPEVSVSPDATAGHFYTGGTTGTPKGVLYTQSCLVTNFLAHPIELGFSSGDTGLVTTPLSHSGGTFLLSALLAGGSVVLRRGFDASSFYEIVETHGVTWTFLVPTMLYRLLDEPVDGTDLSTLENVIYGAAPIRPDRLRAALERFGPVFTQFYGQTEVPNLITTLDRRDHARALESGTEHLLRSAGQPCLLSEVKIAEPGPDETTGGIEELGPDEEGELLVKAPYVFAGYYERPDETDRAIVDGWVRTGDVGRLDEEGYLYLLDRRGDVVVTGGMNVYTSEVERVLGEHPDVGAVVVIGVPHEEWGEAVHALVVPREGRSIDVDAVLEFASDRLAGYKRPKDVEVIEELPETAVGKVAKGELRDRYWSDEDRRIG